MSVLWVGGTWNIRYHFAITRLSSLGFIWWEVIQYFNWKVCTPVKWVQGIILMKWNVYKSLFKTNSSSWIAAAVYQWIWFAALMFQEEVKEVCSLPRKNPRVTLIKQLSKLSFRYGFSTSMSEYSVGSYRTFQKMWDPGTGQNSV